MIKTTCIGAYPKPGFVALPDWFTTSAGTDTSDPTKMVGGCHGRYGR